MTFCDQLQHAIQAEINACAAGHASRIDRLEARIEALCHAIDERDKEIERLRDQVAGLCVDVRVLANAQP